MSASFSERASSGAVIVPAAQAKDALRSPAFAEGRWKLVYFGRCYETFLGVTRGLGDRFDVVNVRRQLEDNAGRLAQDLIDLEATQNLTLQDRDWWDASDLGDRGPYATNLLENAARWMLLWEQRHSGERCVFVVEDEKFARLMCRHMEQAGLAVGWRAPGAKSGWLDGVRTGAGATGRLAKFVARIVSGAAYSIVRKAIVTTARRSTPVQMAALKRCDALLAIWADEDAFPADRPLEKNGYLGRIPGILRSQGAKVGCIAMTSTDSRLGRQSIAGALKAHDPVLLIEDCISVRDIVGAAFGALAAPLRININVAIGGLPLRPVLQYERLRACSTSRAVYSRYLKSIGAALARFGVAPKAILFSYENQPWEKMLRGGIRRHLPQTRVIACQHVPLPKLFINSFPSAAEIRGGLIPDRLLLIGEYFRGQFEEHGFPAKRMDVGGGVRFEENLRSRSGATDKENRPGQGREGVCILCATSIDYHESFELAYKMVVATMNRPGVRLVVNFHPAIPQITRERLRASVLANAQCDQASVSHVTFSDASARDALGDVDLVAYSTSSVGVDALNHHKPILCVHREHGLGYNRMPQEMCFEAHTLEEARHFLDRFVRGDVPALPYEKLSDVIGPVDEGAFGRAVNERAVD